MTLLSVVKGALVFHNMQWQKVTYIVTFSQRPIRGKALGDEIFALIENCNTNESIMNCLVVLSTLENLEGK